MDRGTRVDQSAWTRQSRASSARPTGPGGAPAVADYARHEPEKTLLHEVIRAELVPFKAPWRDGTTHVVMERQELLERLAPLIPSPRAHQVRYHGVLAPCASARDQVVPEGSRAKESALRASPFSEPDGISTGFVDGAEQDETPVVGPSPARRADRDRSLPSRIDWADLLKRVFEVDALRCPACTGRMRLLAAITEPSVARRILEWLALPPRAPPLGPANEIDLGPVVGRSAFEPTLAEAHRDPGFDFDQSPVEDRFSSEDR